MHRLDVHNVADAGVRIGWLAVVAHKSKNSGFSRVGRDEPVDLRITKIAKPRAIAKQLCVEDRRLGGADDL